MTRCPDFGPPPPAATRSGGPHSVGWPESSQTVEAEPTALAFLVRRPDRVGYLFGTMLAARDFANEDDAIIPLYSASPSETTGVLGEPCEHAPEGDFVSRCGTCSSCVREDTQGRADAVEVVAKTPGHQRAVGVSMGGVAGAMDWPEDFAHENGLYQCLCHNCGCLFVGHKRRVTCRVCAAPPAGDTAIVDWLDEIGQRVVQMGEGMPPVWKIGNRLISGKSFREAVNADRAALSYCATRQGEGR